MCIFYGDELDGAAEAVNFPSAAVNPLCKSVAETNDSNMQLFSIIATAEAGILIWIEFLIILIKVNKPKKRKFWEIRKGKTYRATFPFFSKVKIVQNFCFLGGNNENKKSQCTARWTGPKCWFCSREEDWEMNWNSKRLYQWNLKMNNSKEIILLRVKWHCWHQI